VPITSQIKISQLEAFYWIMRLGGFGAAGQKLAATQPAISARIKELEQILGTGLFIRGGKALRPNTAARALYPLAEEALSIIARIENEISQSEHISGIVRIGMGEIVALSWFPSFLSLVNATYPSVHLDICMDVTTNLHRLLEEGHLDIALVSTPGAPQLIAESLGSTPLRWMSSPSLIQEQRDLTMAELADLPIYTLSRSSHLHARMLRWFRDKKIEPKLVHNCNNMSVIIKLIQIGCGIALIPVTLVAEQLQRGLLRTIAPHEPDQKTEFFLVRHQEMVDPTILRIAAMAAQTTIFDNEPTRLAIS